MTQGRPVLPFEVRGRPRLPFGQRQDSQVGPMPPLRLAARGPQATGCGIAGVLGRGGPSLLLCSRTFLQVRKNLQSWRSACIALSVWASLPSCAA